MSLTISIKFVVAFVLVLFRFTGLFIFAPMFSSLAIPMRIKALFCLAMAVCVFSITTPVVHGDLSLIRLVYMVSSELMIGAAIGFGAMLPLIALQLAGQMMGQQIGLGFGSLFSADLNDNTDVLGQVLFLFALAVFLLVGGHHELVRALLNSLDHVPLGGYVPDGRIVTLLTGLMGAMFELGLRVAAPLLCLVFLETVTIGFISRTVPALNLLSLGFPLRILIGIFLIITTLLVTFEAVRDSISDALTAVAAPFAAP